MLKLNKGDTVAIVSLSSGRLGEPSSGHQLTLGKQRLEDLGLKVKFMDNALKGIDYLDQHPEKRAEDLINAFQDDSINGIICAIGGIDTYRLTPYIFTEENKKIISENPKFFMGYSDTTINHLMLYKLGLPTFYGLSFLTDFAELGPEMLSYSLESFETIFTEQAFIYHPSAIWYEERTDFSKDALGVSRISHEDDKGYELLQGSPSFEGHLLGGCIESLFELITGTRFYDEKDINEKYGLFPHIDQWEDAVLFLETSEEKPSPSKLKTMLETLKNLGIFEVINGILVGKPQDEVYYEAYKEVYKDVVNDQVPIVYNVNFGHAYPKMLLQYGAQAKVDYEKQEIVVERK